MGERKKLYSLLVIIPRNPSRLCKANGQYHSTNMAFAKSSSPIFVRRFGFFPETADRTSEMFSFSRCFKSFQTVIGRKISNVSVELTGSLFLTRIRFSKLVLLMHISALVIFQRYKTEKCETWSLSLTQNN